MRLIALAFAVGLLTGCLATGGSTAVLPSAVAPSGPVASQSPGAPPSADAPASTAAVPSDELFRGAVGTPFPTQAGYPEVGATPNGTTTRIHFAGLVFDVPPTWVVHTANVNAHYFAMIAFVGTAPSRAGCFPISFTPPAVGASSCGVDLRLGPDDISILLETQDGPPRLVPLGDPLTAGDGYRVVEIDGVPALRNDAPPGSAPPDHAIELQVQDLSNLNVSVHLYAAVGGRDPGPLLQQVRDVLATVHYESPPVLPDTTSAGERRVIEHAIEAFTVADPGYECFPHVAGESAPAAITKLAGYPAVSTPVNVTCRTELVPSGGFWKLTFTVEWVTGKNAAGSSTLSTYLLSDGTPTWYTSFSNPLP